GVDWGFAVTVGDLFRFLFLAVLLGLYFALLFHYQDRARSEGSAWGLGHSGGASGALASVLGISTGGCTVMGWRRPGIPGVGLALAGLSSGTLALLANLSVIATTVVFILVALGVGYLAWRVGGPGPLPMGGAKLTRP